MHNVLVTIVWNSQIWTSKIKFGIGKMKKTKRKKEKKESWKIEVKVKSDNSDLLL